MTSAMAAEKTMAQPRTTPPNARAESAPNIAPNPHRATAMMAMAWPVDPVIMLTTLLRNESKDPVPPAACACAGLIESASAVKNTAGASFDFDA